MGVDLSKMKQVQQETEAKNAKKGGSGYIFWTPKPDKNRIRLMPPWTSEGNWRDSFFRELAMHWGIGTEEEKQHFSCPTRSKHGPEVQSKACPICMQVEKLRGSGNPADAEYANELRARTRYYSNIVDMADPVYTAKDVLEWQTKQQDKTRECPFTAGDTKVQVYSYGPQVFDELLAVFADQGIDITDFSSGHDIIITREGAGRTTKYKTRPDFQATVFKFIGKPYLEVLPNLDTIVTFQPLQAMQAALDGAPASPQLSAPAQAARPVPSLPAASAPAVGIRPAVAQTAPAPAAAAGSLDMSEAPHCFSDKQTCNPQDAECIGGKKGEDEYEPCPFYTPCHAAKFGAPKPASRRAAKSTATAAPADNSVPSSVEALEAEMKKMMQ